MASAKKTKKNLIIKTKNTDTSSNKQSFDFLKNVNDWLESVPSRMNNAFDNMVGDDERAVQAKVDRTCVWLAWKVNVSVEGVRQKLIKALHNMYKTTVVGIVMSAILNVKRIVQNPLYFVGYLLRFFADVLTPFGLITSWFKMLSSELPRLAKNLANIGSSLPPTSSNSNINFNAFKLRIKTISVSDVTSSPDNLPAPDVMFPEPEKPFTKDSFNEVFMNTSAKLKSNKLIYKLNKKGNQVSKISK